MTEAGKQELKKHLLRNAEGATEKVAEENLHSAFEEFYVGMVVSRMALNTEPERLTPEHVELTARLAWALSDLYLSDGYRTPDDLERVNTLAEQVRDQ